MSSLLHIDSIKKLLSEGKTESALDCIILITEKEHLNKSNQSSILLKNRIENLQQQTIEGTISQTDASLELAKISKAVLMLATNIEDKLKKPVETTTPILEKPVNTSRKTLVYWRNKAVIGIIMLIAIGLFYHFVIASPSRQPFDLKISLKADKYISKIKNLKLQVKIGKKVLADTLITDTVQVLHFQNVEGSLRHEAISLELSDTSIYKLIYQNALTTAENSNISVQLIPKMTLYQGRVLYYDDVPAADIIVDFEKGLVRDTTDRDGNYEVWIPNYIHKDDRVFLALFDAKGKDLHSQNMQLHKDFLKILKIGR